MKLMYRDRVRVVTLACLFVVGLGSVAGRRFGWARSVTLVGSVAVAAAVVALLIRWARSAPDAEDHIP